MLRPHHCSAVFLLALSACPTTSSIDAGPEAPTDAASSGGPREDAGARDAAQPDGSSSASSSLERCGFGLCAVKMARGL